MTAVIVNPLTNPKYENCMHLTVTSPHCYPNLFMLVNLTFTSELKTVV